MSSMPDPLRVLESVNDGVYVTDAERNILYWNPAAERITGWTTKDIVGRTCYDEVLCHEDKDGRRLCGKEHCPLHRAIVTGNSSTVPIIVFAGCKDGHKVPVRVSVAPIRAADGTIVGGVETFRDLSAEIKDFQRAQRIQSNSMRLELPSDPRIAFRAHRVELDIVGGDFLTACRLDEDRYGFLLADVTGHGMAASLYTMCLYPLWQAHHGLLRRPAEFAEAVSRGLCELMGEEGAFAASTCGLVDLAANEVLLTGAGNPAALIFRTGEDVQRVNCEGLPLGLMAGADYEETSVRFGPGDCLLMFTDGATDIQLTPDQLLGVDGLSACLVGMGYPGSNVELKDVETELLRISDRVRFGDDMTLLEIRRTG